MRYTNVHGLPESFVRALHADPYDKGEADFSATELLKPPQIGHLYRLHEDKLTEDVSDAVYRLLGSGVHEVLDRAYDPEHGMTEQRLFADISVPVPNAGMQTYTISGQMDLREAGKITDYKVTATYSVMKGDFDSWEQQLNIYDWLARQNGIAVTGLEIIAILRDWKKSQRFKVNYPQAAIQIVQINRWSPQEQEEFIIRKIIEHAEPAPRACTTEETWGGIRCKDWCAVADFCPQYQGVGS